MSHERAMELTNLAKKTINRSPRFIFNGEYNNFEIQFYLSERSRLI